MTKIVIDKENEITKLENMLETLTDEKDKQSVRFAINAISGFNDVLSDRHNPFISKYQHDFVSRPTEVVKVGEEMKIVFEIIGIFIFSLFCMSIPILCTLSFVYDWLAGCKFILVIACVTEWIGIMNLLSEIADKQK